MADAHTLMIVAGVVLAAVIAWVLFARRAPKVAPGPSSASSSAKGGAAGAKTLPKSGAAAGAKALPANTSAAAATGGAKAATKTSAVTETVKTKATEAKAKAKSEPAPAKKEPAKSEPAKKEPAVEAKPAAKAEPVVVKTEPKVEAKPEPVAAKAAPAPAVEAKKVEPAKVAETKPAAAPPAEKPIEPTPISMVAPEPAKAKAEPAPVAKVEAKAEPKPEAAVAKVVDVKPAAQPAVAKAEPKPEPKPEPAAAKAVPAPSPSTAKVDAAGEAAKAAPVEFKKVESVRPALSSHHEIQDSSIPAAADVPLGTPAFAFTTAAARWQPESAKDSGDAHATLLEEHLFVLAANRNGTKGSAAIKALREAKGSNGWRSVLASKGAEATPTVAAFFPGGGTSVELARIGDGQGFRLRGGTLTKITGDGTAREVERKTEQVDVGDLYILCSAELARTVPEEEIRELLMLDLDPSNGVRDMLAMSGDRDPNADVNVLVVRVDPLGGY